MLNLALLTVMLSLLGAFALRTPAADGGMQQTVTDAEAAGAAVYRDAVARYFGLHDSERDTGVGIAALRTAGLLRPWSTLAVGQWDNYRALDGTIYIYSDRAPRAGLAAALVARAQRSLLAGEYRAGSTTLQSPLYGDTGIPLAPLLARRTLPSGAPVWLAAAQ